MRRTDEASTAYAACGAPARGAPAAGVGACVHARARSMWRSSAGGAVALRTRHWPVAGASARFARTSDAAHVTVSVPGVVGAGVAGAAPPALAMHGGASRGGVCSGGHGVAGTVPWPAPWPWPMP
jgi:hypothetical protein